MKLTLIEPAQFPPLRFELSSEEVDALYHFLMTSREDGPSEGGRVHISNQLFDAIGRIVHPEQ